MLCCDYAMPDMSLKTHLCRPRKAAAHTGGCRAPHPGSTCLPHTHSLSAGPQEPHSRRCQQCACSIREQMTSALPLACTAQYVHTRQQHMVPSHLQVHMLARAGTAQSTHKLLAVQQVTGSCSRSTQPPTYSGVQCMPCLKRCPGLKYVHRPKSAALITASSAGVVNKKFSGLMSLQSKAPV